MIGHIRARLSGGHLIGLVALVFAIGGGIAVANVPRDSVGAGKLKPTAVHFKHINPGSVHYSKLSQGLKNRVNAIGRAAPAQKINLRTNFGTALTTLYRAHGLRLEGQCTSTPTDASPNLRVVATNDNNVIRIAQNAFPAPNPSGVQPIGGTGAAQNFADFDFDQSTNDGVSLAGSGSVDSSRAGTLVFAGSDGSVVTIDYNVSVAAQQPQGDCVIVGTVLAA